LTIGPSPNPAELVTFFVLHLWNDLEKVLVSNSAVGLPFVEGKLENLITIYVQLLLQLYSDDKIVFFHQLEMINNTNLIFYLIIVITINVEKRTIIIFGKKYV
jgi:hypothetical protein